MLKIIVPIVIGGLIGYCTNYIAIKMLFRPRKEVFIGKWKVPFTPGVIPKNQKRIASAVGNAVSEKLITKEDLAAQISQSGGKEQLVSSITDSILASRLNAENTANYIEPVSDKLSDVIMEEVRGMDFTPTIREIANQALQDYLRNPMIAMFLNNTMLEGIYGKINDSIKEYLDLNGKSKIEGFIQKKAEGMDEKTVGELLEQAGITKENVTEILNKVFDKFIEEKGESLLNVIDIRGIVVNKIEAMDAKDLEELVMYVMENELKAVINLGAVIGAVIGMINIFI